MTSHGTDNSHFRGRIIILPQKLDDIIDSFRSSNTCPTEFMNLHAIINPVSRHTTSVENHRHQSVPKIIPDTIPASEIHAHILQMLLVQFQLELLLQLAPLFVSVVFGSGSRYLPRTRHDEIDAAHLVSLISIYQHRNILRSRCGHSCTLRATLSIEWHSGNGGMTQRTTKETLSLTNS